MSVLGFRGLVIERNQLNSGCIFIMPFPSFERVLRSSHSSGILIKGPRVCSGREES